MILALAGNPNCGKTTLFNALTGANARTGNFPGVTVTRSSEKRRIDDLKKNIKARHYHVTFEPLFDDIGEIDFEGIDWIVIGTETGNRKGKSYSRPEWVLSIAEQAKAHGIPVFMKEDLLPIMGDERMIQELPEQFTRRIQWIWIQ